jgi:hypothetical protein
MWDYFLGRILDSFRFTYLAARNRPHVSCDNVSTFYPALWGPDYFFDIDGKEIASGIEITVHVSFLLANHGPVKTGIKDIYIEVIHNKKKKGRLEYQPDTKDKRLHLNKVQDIQIGPREPWGPCTLRFSGSIWNIDEPTKDTKAKLVIEPMTQRPLKKNIGLHFK